MLLSEIHNQKQIEAKGELITFFDSLPTPQNIPQEDEMYDLVNSILDRK